MSTRYQHIALADLGTYNLIIVPSLIASDSNLGIPRYWETPSPVPDVILFTCSLCPSSPSEVFLSH